MRTLLIHNLTYGVYLLSLMKLMMLRCYRLLLRLLSFYKLQYGDIEHNSITSVPAKISAKYFNIWKKTYIILVLLKKVWRKMKSGEETVTKFWRKLSHLFTLQRLQPLFFLTT